MKTKENQPNLSKYFIDDKVFLTGFRNFDNAEQYAAAYNGDIIEVGFVDANDNPQPSNVGNLIENRLVYFADAGPEYVFLYSDNPDFKSAADRLIAERDDMMDKDVLNKILGNGEASIEQDPVIILRNGKFDAVTSREQSKYEKGAKVYEIAVVRERMEGEE